MSDYDVVRHALRADLDHGVGECCNHEGCPPCDQHVALPALDRIEAVAKLACEQVEYLQRTKREVQAELARLRRIEAAAGTAVQQFGAWEEGGPGDWAALYDILDALRSTLEEEGG